MKENGVKSGRESRETQGGGVAYYPIGMWIRLTERVTFKKVK